MANKNGKASADIVPRQLRQIMRRRRQQSIALCRLWRRLWDERVNCGVRHCADNPRKDAIEEKYLWDIPKAMIKHPVTDEDTSEK